MWVRSEYAGELAVLSTWLCALLPWSVSYASGGGDRLIRVYFLYVLFQFAPGSVFASFIDNAILVVEAPSFPNAPATALGFQLWLLGALVFTAALAVSVLYYRDEDRLEERSPVDPVRAIGGLLVAAAVPLTGAAYFVSTGGIGTAVPIGVVFMYALGGLLLVVERT